MLYINYLNNGKTLVHSWHVGCKLISSDTQDFINLIPNNVVMIQADGDELNSILCKFDNLPNAKNKRVQRWHGDIAKFIVDNLIEKC